jgi:hypothetical protein
MVVKLAKDPGQYERIGHGANSVLWVMLSDTRVFKREHRVREGSRHLDWEKEPDFPTKVHKRTESCQGRYYSATNTVTLLPIGKTRVETKHLRALGRAFPRAEKCYVFNDGGRCDLTPE